jgi:hypothetical protein
MKGTILNEMKIPGQDENQRIGPEDTILTTGYGGYK